jgi:hypothetical protein
MMTDTFPELYKNIKQEFTFKRMRNTALLAWLVGLSALLINFSKPETGLSIVPHSNDDAFDLLRAVWWLACTSWGLYGCIEILNSLTREKIDGTWDLQRLTPLSSYRMAVGKLLGPLLFPTFVASLLLPFLFYGLIFSGSQGISWMSRVAPQSLCFLLFVFCFSLLASCFANSRRVVGLIVVFLFFLSNVFFSTTGLLSNAQANQDALSFFGVHLSRYQYLNLLALIFAAWSFKGAQWILGRELLEAPKFWRVPIFILFLLVLGIGHRELGDDLTTKERALWLGALLATLATYSAAFFESPTIDKIRKGLMFSTGFERISRLPVWALASVALSIGTWLALLFVNIESANERHVYIVFPLFVLRDLLIYQWICLSDSRRPQIVTMVVLALIYVVPMYLTKLLEVEQLSAFFAPSIKSNFTLNVVAPLAQVAVVVAVLRAKLKGALEAPKA